MSTNEDLKAAATRTATTEKKESSPVVAALTKATNAMKAVLPKHITPEKMARLALSALRTNRKLAEVAQSNPQSFVAAVMTASQLGLELGVFGEAHLVPFGSEIALIPGYQGLVKLVLNSRFAVDVYAHEVRSKDHFKLTYGLHRSLEHVPLSNGGFPLSDEERGPLTGFYAVAELANGSRTFWVVSLADAYKTRDASKGYIAAKKYKKEHTWDTHFEAMGRKTAVRRLCNWLPKSAELAAALALDAAHDRGATATVDGDFTVVAGDDDVTTTGAAGTQDGEGGDPGASEQTGRPSGTGAQSGGAESAESKPAGKPAASAADLPTIDDAIALVRADKYDDATDLARQLGGDAPVTIAGMIKSRQGNKSAKAKSSMNIE